MIRGASSALDYVSGDCSGVRKAWYERGVRMGWSARTTFLVTKLALATVAVLSVVSLFFYQQLTSRERVFLLSSKTRAANMVTDLFAASLGAPLDFGDAEAVEVELGNLRSNSEITDAAVWSSSSNLLARLQ